MNGYDPSTDPFMNLTLDQLIAKNKFQQPPNQTLPNPYAQKRQGGFISQDVAPVMKLGGTVADLFGQPEIGIPLQVAGGAAGGWGQGGAAMLKGAGISAAEAIPGALAPSVMPGTSTPAAIPGGGTVAPTVASSAAPGGPGSSSILSSMGLS